jgi:hypothetical protein
MMVSLGLGFESQSGHLFFCPSIVYTSFFCLPISLPALSHAIFPIPIVFVNWFSDFGGCRRVEGQTHRATVVAPTPVRGSNLRKCDQCLILLSFIHIPTKYQVSRGSGSGSGGGDAYLVMLRQAHDCAAIYYFFTFMLSRNKLRSTTTNRLHPIPIEIG